MVKSQTAPKDEVLIRAETVADWDAVRELNVSAFDSPTEAKLVDLLRDKAPSYISLVAELDRNVVGHILFTPVTLSGFESAHIAGLAPMAVLPDFQRRGIGTALVRRGLEQCRQDGYGAVVVLGHPDYYPRFGFRPASEYGIKSEYDVPSEAFMLVELQEQYLAEMRGTVRYHAAFGEV